MPYFLLLYCPYTVKNIRSASKDLSFRRETNIERDDYYWIKARGNCYVVPQQHHAAGDNNSSEMSPFKDSFVCSKAILQACYI